MLQPLRDFPLLRNAFNEGKAAGMAEALLDILEARGLVVPESVKQSIYACTDCELLTGWRRRAVSAPSLDEILA